MRRRARVRGGWKLVCSAFRARMLTVVSVRLPLAGDHQEIPRELRESFREGAKTRKWLICIRGELTLWRGLLVVLLGVSVLMSGGPRVLAGEVGRKAGILGSRFLFVFSWGCLGACRPSWSFSFGVLEPSGLFPTRQVGVVRFLRTDPPATPPPCIPRPPDPKLSRWSPSIPQVGVRSRPPAAAPPSPRPREASRAPWPGPADPLPPPGRKEKEKEKEREGKINATMVACPDAANMRRGGPPRRRGWRRRARRGPGRKRRRRTGAKEEEGRRRMVGIARSK